MNETHPVAFSVDYPDRALNRLTTALRIFTVIPIAIVLASIGGYSGAWGNGGDTRTTTIAVGGTGLLFLAPLRRPPARGVVAAPGRVYDRIQWMRGRSSG